MKTCYLAGPIAGLDYTDAVTWRTAAIQRLKEAGIQGRSPMRSKEFLAGRKLTNQGCEENPLSSQKGIVTRDHFDVRTSDVILMNLSAATRLSLGSAVEIGWASAYKKPIVTVLDLDNTANPHTHAFVRELSGYIVPTLDEALDIVISILG